MSGWRNSLLLWSLCFTVTVAVCQEGCTRQERASGFDATAPKVNVSGQADNPAVVKIQEPVRTEKVISNVIPAPEIKRGRYANDMDRLNQLSERIKRVCRKSCTVTLGIESSSTTGSVISIDYGLFDRLSDDGAAVLIAEAIVATKSKPVLSSQTQMQADTARSVLQTDEAVGRYVAMAGFGQEGFTEWLEARKSSAVDLQHNSVPDKARIAAFMRGYSSGRYGNAR